MVLIKHRRKSLRTLTPVWQVWVTLVPFGTLTAIPLVSSIGLSRSIKAYAIFLTSICRHVLLSFFTRYVVNRPFKNHRESPLLQIIYVFFTKYVTTFLNKKSIRAIIITPVSYVLPSRVALCMDPKPCEVRRNRNLATTHA